MSQLILIKHAPPEIDPLVSSEQWRLGEKGRRLCEPLARRLAEHHPSVLISSNEPKAMETAAELSRLLGIAHRAADGLQEHDRRNVPHLRSGEFISMIELFFRRPGELVLGRETADEAYRRFSAAITAIVEDNLDQSPAVVTHGTVLALFLARHNPDHQAFGLWRRLGLPSFVVVDRPGFGVHEIVERVD